MNRSSHYTSDTGPAQHGPFAGMFQPAEALADAITQAGMAVVRSLGAFHRGLAYRQTVRALSRLDDRTLNDIGILRADITHVARDLTTR